MASEGRLHSKHFETFLYPAVTPPDQPMEPGKSVVEPRFYCATNRIGWAEVIGIRTIRIASCESLRLVTLRTGFWR
jgi:hypothetical protein